jgi:hypothetical protein
LRSLLLFMIPAPPLTALFYIDESGDLGWTFTSPYGAGGSSRYLTIAAICVPSEKKHIPKRVIRDLYNMFKWPTSVEKKWADMTHGERCEFSNAAYSMCVKNPDIFLHAIVVKKENVQAHIRHDSNKLYNYMLRLALLDRMAQCQRVILVPDPRSIKVKSGNSLHDYLLTELWFSKKVTTDLQTCPVASDKCAGIQFADMLAGVVQGRFEFGRFDCFLTLVSKLTLKRLFF